VSSRGRLQSVPGSILHPVEFVMRRWWPALILGLVALLASWAAARAFLDWQFRAALKTVNEDIARGRLIAAKGRLVDLAARWPGRGEVVLQLGLCEKRAGRIDEALEAWGRVLPGSTDAGPIALQRGKLALEHGRLTVAEESLEKALSESGVNHDEALSALARVLRLEGRLSELRNRLVKGLGHSVVPAELLRELWMLDTEPLPVQGVRAFLEKAGREVPADDRVWLGRANLATRTGLYDEASSWLHRCEGRRTRDPAVWRVRLDLAQVVGDTEAVRRLLGQSSGGRLQPAEALALRAWFAAQESDRGAERAALDELLKVDPANTVALERLAGLAVEAGETQRVVDLRRRKVELDKARESFKRILAKGDLRQAGDLSRLAGVLGRRLESRGWAILAAEPDHTLSRVREALARLARDEPVTVSASDLLAELRPPVNSSPGRTSTSRGWSGWLPAYVDDAEAAGLRFTFDNGRSLERQFPESGSGGVGLLDYDGDGWLDVYCVQGGRFPPPPGRVPNADRLFRNRGDGTFEDATESSGIAAMSGGYGHGVTVGDYDNDGHPDLFVTRWRSYALYRNRGDGTFEDATRAAGLGGDRDWPTSSAFADLDGDGDLDLYVCHYLLWNAEHPKICPHPKTGVPSYCDPNSLPHLPDQVFRNDHGRFVDVTAAAGFVDRDGRGLGVVASDLDEDGRVDLYVANDTTANYLYRNLGGFRFEEIGVTSGVAANASGGYQAGMGVAAGDLDGDGRLDLVVTNFYGESTTFHRNLGGCLFVDNSARIGLAVPTRFMLGFGIAFVDANNDRNLDLLITNGHVNDFRPDTPYAMPAQLLLGDAHGRLTDVTRQAGPPFEVLRVGRGLAAGDLDNDGRIDALILGQTQPIAFFHNKTAHDGHFVTLRLEGTVSNRDAVGSRVQLVADGRSQVAQRVGGGSYQSANDGRVHFGLGPARLIDSLEVTWPSGRVDRFLGLVADKGYLLREGADDPRPLAGFKSD
jgi:tetratricopeptide (TPR) repeat protein